MSISMSFQPTESKNPCSPWYFAHWVLPVDQPPIQNGFLQVADGVIKSVGSIETLPDSLKQKALSQLGDSELLLITPGLVNTHAHLELTFPEMIPLEAGESMADWLLKVVQQTRQAGSDDDINHRCQAGVAEMLKTGTTCVNDISQQGHSFKALANSGLRGVVSMEFFHPGHGLADNKSVNAIADRYKQHFECYKNHPLLHPGLSPHSLYNVSPKIWQHVVKACQPFLVHAHLAESNDELNWLAGKPNGIDELHQQLLGNTFKPLWLNQQSPSTVNYLNQFGLLDRQLMIAHGSFLNLDEIKQLADSSVGLAHCPRSNLALHHKTIHWPDWENSTVAIGLGTDSKLSSPDLDIRAEARAAKEHHGWESKQALQAATLGGATVLNLDSAIGSLAIGKQADFCVWKRSEKPDISKPAEDYWLDCNTMLKQAFVSGHPLPL